MRLKQQTPLFDFEVVVYDVCCCQSFYHTRSDHRGNVLNHNDENDVSGNSVSILPSHSAVLFVSHKAQIINFIKLIYYDPAV